VASEFVAKPLDYKVMACRAAGSGLASWTLNNRKDCAASPVIGWFDADRRAPAVAAPENLQIHADGLESLSEPVACYHRLC
jgi:hypothetical protein